MRPSFGPRRLVGYAMLMLLAMAIVQVGASVIFYEAIDRQALYEDHARRVAELLLVSDRVHDRDPAATAPLMSSRYLDVKIGNHPKLRRSGGGKDIAEIRDYILAWEPILAARPLRLAIVGAEKGRRDLIGSMQFDDGTWLNFRSRDISSSWPIVLRAIALTVSLTLLCVGFGLLALRKLAAPLRRLSEAMAHPEALHAPLDESGPADLRGLARSFNAMQARIADLEDDQSRSFEAISHDLRTPLSRLKLASDFVSDSDIGRIVRSSADEMEALLMSLQRFLRAQHLESAVERLDLTLLVRSVIERFDERVRFVGPAQAMATTYAEPLRTALDPLIENALHHGTTAEIAILRAGGGWWIEISDDGPGIPEEHLEAILDPFYRVDEARARDTDGFGLGIPTAHRLLQRFGGDLSFRNAPTGGLIVRVVVPIVED